jgi:Ni,Fe-hydrogenase I small subunit
MYNTLSIQAAARITNDGGVSGISRSFSKTPAGVNYIQGMQTFAASAASTMALGSCATLGYVAIYNPSTNTATVTITAAPMILVPGDVMVFHPSSMAVTLQATAGATGIQIFGTEA